MSDLGDKTVREFLKRTLPYNPDSFPKFILPQTRTQHFPTEEDLKLFSQSLQSDPNLRGKNLTGVTITNGYDEIFVRMEPDHEFAEHLIHYSQQSIDHMFGFIDSPYLQKPSFSFVVPRSVKEIKTKRLPQLTSYLVSSLGSKVTLLFKAEVEGKIVEGGLSYEKSTYGETPLEIGLRTVKGNVIISNRSPSFFFYNTSSGMVPLVETPPFHVLSKALEPHTLMHIRELVRGSDEIPVLYDICKLHISRQTKLARALVATWLRTYNEEKRVGLTSQEIFEREEECERLPEYKGAKQLSQRIEQLGVRRAVELYVRSPYELFK